MIVAIAGGHGQIALLLEKELVDRGHEAVALVRNPDHVPDVEKQGARAEVIDLEHTTVEALSAAVAGVDAVVFAAGAGPDSGAARKETVAVLLADAAVAAGVERYVMVSSMGADSADPDSDDVFQVYLRAKGAADADLRARTDLAWTIVRPGRLTDAAGTGRVQVGESVGRGEIPRADVAALLAELLSSGAGLRAQVEVIGGSVPVAEAAAAVHDRR